MRIIKISFMYRHYQCEYIKYFFSVSIDNSVEKYIFTSGKTSTTRER